MEIFVTCLWIATVALLSWECQTWDAASDIVGDFLSSELAAMAEALPNQDMGILSLQAATALASINCVFWAFTLFMYEYCSIPQGADDPYSMQRLATKSRLYGGRVIIFGSPAYNETRSGRASSEGPYDHKSCNKAMG
ncbi:hypothetical protein WAI453_013461 [Rhynchosporium graminicola]